MANYTDPIKTREVYSITSSATPTVHADKYMFVSITALAAAITGVTVTGNPVDFQELTFRIKDNGTNRAITWGSQFAAKGVALPTTTTANKLLTTRFQYDSVAAKWGCISSVVEA